MADVESEDGYVRIPKDEYESMKATIETLEDEDVMRQLKNSVKEDSKSLSMLKEEIFSFSWILFFECCSI